MPFFEDKIFYKPQDGNAFINQVAFEPIAFTWMWKIVRTITRILSRFGLPDPYAYTRYEDRFQVMSMQILADRDRTNQALLPALTTLLYRQGEEAMLGREKWNRCTEHNVASLTRLWVEWWIRTSEQFALPEQLPTFLARRYEAGAYWNGVRDALGDQDALEKLHCQILSERYDIAPSQIDRSCLGDDIRKFCKLGLERAQSVQLAVLFTQWEQLLKLDRSDQPQKRLTDLEQQISALLLLCGFAFDQDEITFNREGRRISCKRTEQDDDRWIQIEYEYDHLNDCVQLFTVVRPLSKDDPRFQCVVDGWDRIDKSREYILTRTIRLYDAKNDPLESGKIDQLLATFEEHLEQ